MPSRIDYQAPLPADADTAYSTMVDAAYLRARLASIGGPGAMLEEHTSDADGARYRVRHGLDSSDLPSIVRTLVPGDLLIERAESWTRKGPGLYLGDVRVALDGTPASAAGGMRLQDADGGAAFEVRVEVTVNVPLFGGRIEAVVGEQITTLLDMEAEFMKEWLAGRR